MPTNPTATPEQELAAVQEAMTKAFAMKALLEGKKRDFHQASNLAGKAQQDATTKFNTAKEKADIAHEKAIMTARETLQKVATESTNLVVLAELAVKDAESALVQYQNQVREEYGAVIDLLPTPSGGGSTRL